jgi:hypothetical protein
MTTREKIIVGLMCLAILYGAWELVGNRGTAKPTAPPAGNTVDQVRTFVGDLTQKMVAEKVPAEYLYLINQASDQWNKDPFILTQEPLSTERKSERTKTEPEKISARPTLEYSGYLQVGTSILAIINGMEYAVGDALTLEGYYVKSVSPRNVVIARINGTETMELPIQELIPE